MVYWAHNSAVLTTKYYFHSYNNDDNNRNYDYSPNKNENNDKNYIYNMNDHCILIVGMIKRTIYNTFNGNNNIEINNDNNLNIGYHELIFSLFKVIEFSGCLLIT